MIANCMISADCYHQEDVDACKLVHMVGYTNPNTIQLFLGLATLFVTDHLVFGSLNSLSSAPRFSKRKKYLE